MIERLHPDQIGYTHKQNVYDFIESDYKIRRGLCPNDCGLLHQNEFGQECQICNFICNKLSEIGFAS